MWARRRLCGIVPNSVSRVYRTKRGSLRTTPIIILPCDDLSKVESHHVLMFLREQHRRPDLLLYLRCHMPRRPYARGGKSNLLSLLTPGMGALAYADTFRSMQLVLGRLRSMTAGRTTACMDGLRSTELSLVTMASNNRRRHLIDRTFEGSISDCSCRSAMASGGRRFRRRVYNTGI